jgi:hypothetical protein
MIGSIGLLDVSTKPKSTEKYCGAVFCYLIFCQELLKRSCLYFQYNFRPQRYMALRLINPPRVVVTAQKKAQCMAWLYSSVAKRLFEVS